MASDQPAGASSENEERAAADAASAPEDPFFGRMNDPTGSAAVQGLCGDEMEFYLYIRDGVIEEARYYTQGCDDTRRCARAAAMAAQGKSVPDALTINARQIMDADVSLGEGSRHCAILAVITLYRAIADFLIRP